MPTVMPGRGWRKKSLIFKMKTILSKFDNSFFVRNFLRTDALDVVLSESDTRLVLLVPPAKMEYYRKEFPERRIIFEALQDVKKFPIERFFNFLERSSIHTNTVYMLLRSEFEKTKSNLSAPRRFFVFGSGVFLWWIGKFKFWRSLIRKIYFLIPSHVFADYFSKYKPDLVFCPYMVFGDYLFLKEAKKAGLKTLGMTLSWDNLYSKTFLLAHPDNLIVQTDKIKSQAVRMGDYRGEIFVAGIPQYDIHFKQHDIIPREDFINSLGGDPSKKLILYAFSGKAGLNIDFDVAKIIAGAVSREEIKNSQILLRPYPRTDFPEEKLESIKKEYGVLAASPVSHIGSGDSDWEFDDKSVSFLVNSLQHADLVITMYSTFFIEAAIYNKPLIGVAFDGHQERGYWDSARRFFDWDHLRDIESLNGIWLVNTKNELIEAVKKCLDDPGYIEDGRYKIVLQQVGFTDGLSGDRVGKIILNLL